MSVINVLSILMKSYQMHLRTTLLFLIVFANTCFAQGYRSAMDDYYISQGIDGGRFWKRMYIGIGKEFVPGKATVTFRGYADSTFKDYKDDLSIKSKESYVVHIGNYLPMALISDNSMLVLNIELTAASLKLTYDSVAVTAKKQFAISYETYRAGLPISIEYRMGGDVLLNKRQKMLFGIGGGICPQIIKSDDYDKQSPLLFTPFAKAELGAMAGLAFKLRIVYYWGTFHYGTTEEYGIMNTPNNYVKSEFNGGAGVTVSLIILPFSFMWNK